MDNYIGSEKIIEKKLEYLLPCSYHFYKTPPQLVKGEMQYMYDSNGKKYTDFFAGVSVMNCGHCNPEILEATIKQMQTLQHTTSIYLTQPVVDIAEKLANVLPGDLKRSFFCQSGSEANEGAYLLARLFTNKKGIISIEGGLHGRTYLTSATTNIPMWRTDPFIETKDFYTISQPIDKTSAEKSIKELQEILEQSSEKIACFVAEPIQGNGGIITPPNDYFKRIKKLLEEYNVLMIIDEVQTGFARTGKMFAIEHYDVVPDVMVMAKALGNGTPISAFSTTDEIANVFTKPSASTLGGNPVSSQTSIAVLNYIEKYNLVHRANELGTYLKEGLIKLKSKYNIIKEVRGIGLMLGAELITNNQPASNETDLILEYMKDNGILIGKNGLNRNVLAFQPPLVIEKDDIDNMLITLDKALDKLKK